MLEDGEELQAGAAAATAEAVRLRAELDEIEVAAGARADAERQLAEARDRARQAEQEGAATGERRAAVETELTAAKQQLASAEREHAQAVQRATALAEERDGLRRRLAGVSERLEQAEAAMREIGATIGTLRTAGHDSDVTDAGIDLPTNFSLITLPLDPERIAATVQELFDLRPAAIIRDLDLRRPIYRRPAAYGHFGRDDRDFTWERLDKVDALRAGASDLSESKV